MRAFQTILCATALTTACFPLLAAPVADRSRSALRQSANTVVHGKMGTAIDNYLTNAAAHGYSGIVLVGSGGRVILHKGYGWADRDRGLPMRPDALFALSSIDKTFTAAAILKLVQDGRLAVTDKVSKFIPGWPADKAEITIEQLMLHTSGLPLDVARDAELINKEELLTRAFAVGLRTQPGAKWFYSNSGYSILAVVVEAVSKESFETYAQRELFAPAGMTNTRFRRPDEANGIGYCGYKFFYPECRPDKTALIDDGPAWSLRGNSGRATTAVDLFRWTEALKVGRPLSLQTQALMNRPQVPTTLRGSMGYGWFIEQDARRGRVISHNGGDGIVAANWRRLTDRDLVIVEFTNNSRGGAYRTVGDALLKLALGEAVPATLPAASAETDSAALRRFQGTYKLASGETFRIDIKNGQLFIPLSTPGVAKWLSAQPSLADNALDRSAVQTVTAVIEGLQRKDFEPLRTSLWDPKSFAAEQAFWSSYWPTVQASYGNLRDVIVIGSALDVSASNPKVQAPEVRLVAVLEKGLQYIEAQKVEDGWSLNISNDAPLPPGGYRLVPSGRGEFLTYVFANSEIAKIKFDDQGRVHLQSRSGSMTGIRTE